jgi:hypothetical protein
MATRMQQRKGTAAQWISTNSGQGPVLNAGEIGYELDTNKFKIGDGVNHWVNLNYFIDGQGALAEITALIDGAPGALNTLNELAAAINDDPAFFTTIATNLSSHEADTTNVHGIADTSILVTTTGTQTLTNKTITSPSGIVKGDVGLGNVDNTSDANKPISTATQTALNLKADASAITELAQDAVNTAIVAGVGLDKAYDDIANTITLDIDSTVATKSYADSAVSTHNDETTNVHGIADTQDLATQDYVNDQIANSTGDYPLLAGDGLEWDIDNEQFAVNSTIARLDAPTFTGTVSGITKSMVGLENVDNTSDANKPISDATQTELDLKAPLADPTFTGTVSGITKSMVGLGSVDNTSDSDKMISTATQAALDLKAPIASPTFTGTVSGVTKAMVGLGNAQNTSDADKPISTATQSALDLKSPLASPTFTGEVTVPDLIATGNVTVEGDLTVNGTNFAASATSITIEDNMVQLAHQNAANTVDLGLVVGYNDGSAKHSGLVRDVSDAKWKLFKGVTTEPTTTVDFTQGSLDDLAVAGFTASSATIGDVSNTELQYLNGVTAPVQSQLDSKLGATLASNTYAPLSAPTFTGTVSGITKAMVGLGNVDNTTDANKPTSTATQAALDLKAPLANPTFTGTVSGVTKAMVGLGSVDNTSDLDKIISTAAQTALDLKAPLDSPTFTGTVAGITKAMVGLGNVANTSDADKAISTATQNALDLKAPLASPTFTGTVSGITKGMVGLSQVDNTSDANKPISTLTQTALDAKLNSSTAATTYAPIASPTFTGTVAGITKSMVGLANVDNTSDINKPVSSATQEELNLKLDILDAEDTYAPIDSPTFTGTVAGVTKSMVGLGNVDNTSDADKPISDDTQVALDLKAPLANPTFTGTVSGITKSMVGLGSVDNTSDANKPVSTATQTALDLKASLASPTFTGTVTLPTGTVTSGMILDGTIVAGDLADGAVTSAKILDGTIVNADINASAAIDWTKLAISSTISETEAGYLDGVTSAIQTQLNNKAPLASPALTGTPTAPLAATGTNTTQVATTSFVQQELAVLTTGAPAALNTLDELAAALGDDANYAATITTALGNKAPLASPALTGTPTSPTAAADTNTTQVATTAYVVGQASAATPAMNGTAAVGTSLKYARADHVHASDTTRAPLASPTFTGTVTIPNGAALGTPASATLTNATGLPVATGISGLGSGVATFLATPSSANLASMLTDEIGTGNIVLSELATSPQNASYLIVAADRGKMVEMNVAGANTITVQPNSTVSFPVGTQIDILQVGAGQTTVTAGAGVTINGTPGLKLRAQWSSATLIKRANPDTWVVVGDLSA